MDPHCARPDQNVVDYDDLLELWLELLDRNRPETAAYFSHRFRHVLVDEYQDTNTLQAQIVDLIGSHHRVMAVGDDAQCIYSWRGANFENILTFPDRHPGTVIHRIETNYRSTPQILALANGVLLAQPKGRHFDKELRAAPRQLREALLRPDDGRPRAGAVHRPAHPRPRRRRLRARRHRHPLPRAFPGARHPARALAPPDSLPDHERRALLRAGAHPRPRRAAALRLQPVRHRRVEPHRRAPPESRRQEGRAENPRRRPRPRAAGAEKFHRRPRHRRRQLEGPEGREGGVAEVRRLARAGRRDDAHDEAAQRRRDRDRRLVWRLPQGRVTPTTSRASTI